MRPRQDRAYAAQLAVPARSPYRRVYRPRATLPQLTSSNRGDSSSTRADAQLPDAGRMGATSDDLSRVAAQPRYLAREVRAGPARLRQDGGCDRRVRADLRAGQERR